MIQIPQGSHGHMQALKHTSSKERNWSDHEVTESRMLPRKQLISRSLEADADNR